MAENVRDIEQQFLLHHVKLKSEWLLEALHYVSSIRRSRDKLPNLVYHQWLFADIKESTEPIDGLQAMIDAGVLCEPLVFQIQAVSDIGTSNFKQYKRLEDPTYEEAIEFDQPNQNNSSAGYSCFSLQLFDGAIELKAFEKKRIPELSMLTGPGSKILVFGRVEIRYGYMFLTRANCQFLGGAVEALVRVNNVAKTLSELLNKPIPETKQPIEMAPKQQKPIVALDTLSMPIQLPKAQQQNQTTNVINSQNQNQQKNRNGQQISQTYSAPKKRRFGSVQSADGELDALLDAAKIDPIAQMVHDTGDRLKNFDMRAYLDFRRAIIATVDDYDRWMSEGGNRDEETMN